MCPYLFIHYKGKFVRIRIGEIVYILALEHHCKIVTEKAVFIPHLQLKQIEQHLPAEHFARINRSTIIALDRIEWFDKHGIYLSNMIMDIGERYIEAWKKKIDILIHQESPGPKNNSQGKDNQIQ